MRLQSHSIHGPLRDPDGKFAVVGMASEIIEHNVNGLLASTS